MDYDDVLSIGTRLARLPDRATYRYAAHKQLMQLIPGDDVLWIQASDVHGGGCEVMRGEPWAVDRGLSQSLGRHWTRHVTARWGTAHLGERRPFRVSDIIARSDWQNDDVFRELRDSMPEYQLNIAPPPPARYREWMIVRDRRDFTDDEVALACGVAPVLAALGLMYDRLEPCRATLDATANQPGLTPRELLVLGLLADGLTESGIGRRLGISYRTVEKHLEHLYRKLNCKDRLVAVKFGRELGLLPPF